jgi:hypothetical protein
VDEDHHGSGQAGVTWQYQIEAGAAQRLLYEFLKHDLTPLAALAPQISGEPLAA